MSGIETGPGLIVRGVTPPLRLADFGLIAFDMDSTLISIECVDEIAAMAGKKAEVAAITEAAMRGEIADYKESLRRRVAMLAGVPATDLQRVYDERLRLNPGVERFVGACRAAGLHTLLVSGGFTFFSDRVRDLLQIDDTRSNVLEIAAGALTGRMVDQPWGDICDGEEKRRAVLQTDHPAEHEKTTRTEPLPLPVELLADLEVIDDPPNTRRIIREPREVLSISAGYMIEESRADLVRLMQHWCEAAGDDHPQHVLGNLREIRQRTEATEALTEEIPVGVLTVERCAEPIGIANDRVLPEVPEVRTQRLGAGYRQHSRVERRTQPCATLIEQQHSVAREQLFEPAAAMIRECHLVARSALEPDDGRPFVVAGTLRGNNLACVNTDLRAGRLIPVKRHLDALRGHDHAIDGDTSGHPRDCDARAAVREPPSARPVSAERDPRRRGTL